LNYKLEHIGIAVRDLEVSIKTYETLLNTKCFKRETVESEGVITAFFQTENTKIELLEAINENSLIHKFIQKKGEGIHHMAFEVKDIKTEMSRLAEEGYRLLNKEPKQGADQKLVCFIHPKDTSGVLLELCQELNS
jgi:methylmalonyl-CoA/ethylmalonyl-CoA epimerase